MEGRDPNEETSEEKDNKDNQEKKYNDCLVKVDEFTSVIKQLIFKLSNFTSTYVGSRFFIEQYETVMDMLMRAFGHNENQSMLLLSRSNTVLHQFISKIKNGLIKRLNNEDIK